MRPKAIYERRRPVYLCLRVFTRVFGEKRENIKILLPHGPVTLAILTI